MVRPGPVSKKGEIMLEILNLLSEKPRGFRELHRALPKERRAGSFSTLSYCVKSLRSEGFIEKDPETGKLRITRNGIMERKRRLAIKEMDKAKMLIGRAFSSDVNPIRNEWTLARYCGNTGQSLNLLSERLRVDSLEANLLFISHFLWQILGNGKEEEIVDQKQTPDYVWDRLWKTLPPDVEIFKIVSLDMKRLLAWLKTPPGVALLDYVIQQKGEGRIEEIARLAREFGTVTNWVEE